MLLFGFLRQIRADKYENILFSPKNMTGGINVAIKFDSVVASEALQLHLLKSFTINGIAPSAASHRGGIWVTVHLQVPSTPFP